MTVRTVFLDAGGVLVHPNWTRLARSARALGVAASPGALAEAEHPVWRSLDRPETIRGIGDAGRWRTFVSLCFERAGAPLPDEVLDALQAENREQGFWDDVPAEVAPTVARLRAHGVALVVVSNANGRLAEKFARLGLLDAFDHVIDSGKEGVEKPDPALFRIALERSGADPATTVHVGDLYEIDVVGARAAGLRAALLDKGDLHADRDVVRFRSLGDVAHAVISGCDTPSRQSVLHHDEGRQR